MAQLKTAFNPQAVEDVPSSFDPIPAGWYPAQITASDNMPTKAGTGHYIKLEYTLMGDNHAGRKVFTNLNYDNPNPKAVEIANAQLKKICGICGVGSLTDTQQLHGVPMNIKLKVTPATADYDAGNDIQDFKPVNNAQPETKKAPW